MTDNEKQLINYLSKALIDLDICSKILAKNAILKNGCDMDVNNCTQCNFYMETLAGCNWKYHKEVKDLIERICKDDETI